jgi:excinuclease UvrABC nuclease subunit
MTIDIRQLQGNSMPINGVTSGVYFLFHGGELVYIGEGWNCFLRVAEHTRKDSVKEFTSWNFLPIADARERKAVEKHLRSTYKPKYNRM